MRTPRVKSKAAGAYLRALREARKLGRPTIANVVKTSENQIKRIEDGTIDSRGSLWLAFCRAVNGNASDLEYLVTKTDATAEDGQQLARAWANAQMQPLSADETRAMQAALQERFGTDIGDGSGLSPSDVAEWRTSLALLRRILGSVPNPR